MPVSRGTVATFSRTPRMGHRILLQSFHRLLPLRSQVSSFGTLAVDCIQRKSSALGRWDKRLGVQSAFDRCTLVVLGRILPIRHCFLLVFLGISCIVSRDAVRRGLLSANLRRRSYWLL